MLYNVSIAKTKSGLTDFANKSTEENQDGVKIIDFYGNHIGFKHFVFVISVNYLLSKENSFPTVPSSLVFIQAHVFVTFLSFLYFRFELDRK